MINRLRSLSTTGVLLALVAFTLTLTPSLVPSSALFMGLLGGLWTAIGYGTGVVLDRLVALPSDESLVGRARRAGVRFGERVRRDLPALPWKAVLAVAAVVYLVGYGAIVVHWQNEVRALVEMPALESVSVGVFALVAVVGCALGVVIGTGLAWLARRATGVVSRRGAGRVATALAGFGAIVVGIVVVLAVLGGVGLGAVDRIYSSANDKTSPGTAEPASTYRSAGTGSAVAWAGLGRHGRDFVAGGPDASEITAVTGMPAIEPIRVYAGIGNAGTLEERAALAVAELKRTGAFDRKVLVVATPTGSGWLEPQAVDAIEYLYGGDTAIVATQYSYEPSWVSFLFAADVPGEAARALVDAVRAEWLTLPESARPKLAVYGLSLGAMGAQDGVGDLDAILEKTDAALFVGPPNASQPWRTLQESRDAGSPAWQPVLDGGAHVRWLSQNGDFDKLSGQWDAPRVAYLQHGTDAVTWLDPAVIWQRPEWLRGSASEGGRSPDVSDSMIWVPGVTYLQLVADMMLGLTPPAHHGHNFGDVMADGWAGVLPDHGLDAAAVDRIQTVMEQYPFSAEDSVWE